MLNKRIIPCLQLLGDSLVKKIKFNKHSYIGDPVNTVRIFNELEVDELCFLDISASTEDKKPNLKILKEIANECFMPLSYGGGVDSIQSAHEILSIGFEKIILNTSAYQNSNRRNSKTVWKSKCSYINRFKKKYIWKVYDVY